MDELYECEACGFDSDIAEDFCESFIMEKAAYGKVCLWCYDEYQQACNEARFEGEEMMGEWELYIYATSSGSINDWGLEITYDDSDPKDPPDPLVA